MSKRKHSGSYNLRKHKKNRKNGRTTSWRTWRASTSQLMRSCESTRPSLNSALIKTKNPLKLCKRKNKKLKRKYSRRRIRRRKNFESSRTTLRRCTTTSPRCWRRLLRRWKIALKEPTKLGRRSRTASSSASLRRSLTTTVLNKRDKIMEKYKIYTIQIFYFFSN